MESKPYIYYIAGKITGDENYREKFSTAERRLREQGYLVLNPAVLPSDLDNYEAYMDIGFTMLKNADGIYMLDNWSESPGAIREWYYAQAHMKHVKWEDEDMIDYMRKEDASNKDICEECQLSFL